MIGEASLLDELKVDSVARPRAWWRGCCAWA